MFLCYFLFILNTLIKLLFNDILKLLLKVKVKLYEIQGVFIR